MQLGSSACCVYPELRIAGRIHIGFSRYDVQMADALYEFSGVPPAGKAGQAVGSDHQGTMTWWEFREPTTGGVWLFQTEKTGKGPGP